MARAFHHIQMVARGDELQGRFHFRLRTERITRTVNEQSWRFEIGEMRRTQILRFSRRVQRIREQQQSRN